MRFLLILLLLLGCTSHKNKNTKIQKKPVVNIVNEAQLPTDVYRDIREKILYWTPKVYAYNQNNPGPVTCILTNNRGVGSCYRGTIHVPAFFRPQSIVETYIHELGHHATGSRSLFFFKEGIATATLEVVLEQENRIPDTWPQYGQTNDNWVRLFMEKNEILPLNDLINWPGYMGGSRMGDYRSWQVYVVGGSFAKWYINAYGYELFRKSFRNKKFHKSHDELEKEWKAFLGKAKFTAFFPGDYLPNSARYDYFIERLR